MPYRVDVGGANEGILERLIELGALDVEPLPDGGGAALMPDGVTPQHLARVLGVQRLSVSPAVSRDGGSVWVLGPRPVRIGSLRIVPARMAAEPGALRLLDSAAFGTGLHPTTALCVEALQDIVPAAAPGAVLDVGTGSGVLALCALMLGVPRAIGLDIDDEALRVAAENARINELESRLALTRGGPESVTGTWALVLANVLAAPLIEMAPDIVRRLGHHGRLVLSGIPSSVEPDVARVYRRAGLRALRTRARGGWVALEMQASW